MSYKQHKQYRLPGYDYAGPGEYFITICTRDRQHYFGHIQEGIMHLSEAGSIAKDNLLMIPKQFQNAVVDTWVVMPNHVHMILIIEGGNVNCRNVINHVPTIYVPTKSGIPNNPMELPVDTIGKMMRWYKGKVSYQCRKEGHTFFWQSRFHDHIIRDDQSLEKIRRYIQHNPLQWKEDRFNPEPGL
ncbi:transposase [Catalinimonas niigatensis]|uniref:transposase n=1 Tax=Catalinimonas niigatensis TaxID=1397264 RepID=UPI002665DA97|nr:transposase [Catalinimonas niigatensis]WPP48358.1 transposase [Catalinimonas niigatensis]